MAVQVLEQGDIYFFYRPRIEHEQATDVEELQRLYMVLAPDGGPVRLIVIGRKRMPEIVEGEARGSERQWGIVDKVAKTPEPVVRDLAAETYQTRTRGTRERPAARPAGEGRYRLVRHEDHTELAYELELPQQPAEVQRELRIPQQAGYILSVKNPERPGPPQFAGRPQASYPKELQQRFGGRKFIDAEPPHLLDYENAQVLLTGARAGEVEEELGLRIDTERETAETAEIFRELHVDRRQHPAKPLFQGKWA